MESKKFFNTSLEIVQSSSILKLEDLDVIISLQPELEDTFLHSQVFRTRTEMEVSVLNDLKFPTPDSKYWQAIREQNVMFTELVFLSYEYRKNQIEIQKLQQDLEKEEDDLEKELMKIEIEKKSFIALGQQKTAKDRIREIREWHEIKKQLLPNLKCSLVDCNEHQLISYTQRWINQSIAMEASGSPAERQNLLGQLRSGITQCIERGILDEVLIAFPTNIQRKIKDEYQSLLQEVNK